MEIIIYRNSKKSIQIKFVDPSSYLFYPDYPKPTTNNEFLKLFPCYSYNYDLRKWIIIKDNNELMQSNTKQYNIIDYHRQYISYVCGSNYENIMYHQLTLTDDLNKLFNEAPNTAIYSIRSFSKYKHM